ncbi:uncharacterized protein Ltn1 [Epargyreus clarus]|uniref:uncharacterized protein Ltn1 n=1 Tax=Epargyreus clarus TaxID=520877 RepID=UPI003C30A44D
MGGKAKQSNRTKNNVRPSSSGRSAELISNKVDPSLLLVGPGKLLPSVFPGLGSGTQERPLSNEFLLCFKKFHKKDPITKIKALNELKELVANSEQDEVVNALSSWAHYYPSLTVDMDRKVREATQACHGDIVRKCGRQVALQLKRLLPAWLLAQHDDYAPAHYIAHNDLNTTFPNDKLSEAIKFCKVEITNLLLDNLKGNAGFLLSGKKVQDDEERQAVLARVTASSLRALCPLPRALPAAWLWDALQPLLCANTFWAFAQNDSHHVRAAWYVLMGVLAEEYPERLATHGRRAVRALLAHREAAPAHAAPHRWRALVAFMHHVEDWPSYMDNNDLLIKRLLDVLENAAWGEATKLTVLIIPILTHLPAELLTRDFFMTFFNASFKGLYQKMLLSVKSERENWNNMIAVCIRYVSTHHQGEDYAVALASWAHRTWLDTALTVPESHAKAHLINSTATHMAGLVKYWLDQAAGGNLIFDQMIRNFWLNIGSTMLTQVEKLTTDRDDTVNLIEAHTLFIMTLKSAFIHGGKRKRSIKFQDEQDETANLVPLQIECDEITYKRFHHNLVDAAEMLIGHYFEFASNHRLVATVIPTLMTLFKEFHSKELFRMLAQKFEAEPIFNFCNRVLKEWLVDENLRCTAVVEVTFILLQYISEEEQNAVFDSFEKTSPVVVEWCLALALAAAGAGVAARAARRWLRAAAAARAARALARRDAPAARRLLLAALGRYEDGEMILSKEAIDGVIETSSELLNNLIAHDAEITLPNETQRLRAERGKGMREGKEGRGRRRVEEDVCEGLEARVQLSAQLLRTLPASHAQCGIPLLLSLFRLTLHIPVLKRARGSAQLALEAWACARDAWRGAAAALAGGARTDLVRSAVQYIHWHLFQDLENLNIQRIDHMVSLCPHFVIPSDDSPVPSDPTDLVVHSKLVLNIERKNQPTLIPLDVFALQVDAIWGNINCPFEDDNDFIAEVVRDKAVLTKETLMLHVYGILFRALYMKTIVLRKVETDDESDEDEPTWCNDILKVDYFQEQFCSVLYDCVILDVLFDRYTFWRHYDIISEVKNRMDNILKEIICEISVDMKEKLTALLGDQADTHGYYWVYANQYYKDMTVEVQREKVAREKETRESDSATIVDLSETKDDDKTDSEVTDKPDDDRVQSEGADVDTDVEDQNESSESTPVSSSFEIIDNTDIVDSLTLSNVGTEPNTGESSTKEEAVPLTDILKAYYNSCKRRKTSYLNKAAKPKANVASKSEDVALYLDMLGEMVLKNGYFHEIQMKAALIKKRKQKTERQMRDKIEYKLTEMELNAEHKVQEGPSLSHERDNEDYINTSLSVNEMYSKYEEDVLYTASDLAMIRSYYCVYAAQVPQVDEFINDVAKLKTEGNLDAVINGYYRHNETLLFERDLKDASWLQLSGTAAVLQALCGAVPRGGAAPAPRWDFTNITLCAVLSSLATSKRLWGTTKMALVARPALELFCAVRRFVSNVPREAMRRRPAAHVAALPREWRDIFAPDANKNIYLLICHVLDNSSNEVTASQVAVIQSLMSAARYLDAGAMPAVLRTGLLSLERIVAAATTALVKTTHYAYKYLAYYTLKSVAPSLIEADLGVLAAGGGSQDADALPTLSLQLYDEPFDTLQELVDAALSTYVVCVDVCEVVPMSDSHSVILGYLLLAVAMHDHCMLATNDLALQYVTVFNTHPYAEGLVPAALRLLPAGVAAFAADAAPALPRRLLPGFVRPQHFRLDEVCTSAVVSRLACGALSAALAGPGSAAARAWWAARTGRDSRALSRLVRAAVAPALLQRQFAQLARRAYELGPSVKVAITPAERAVSVSLQTDERVLALRVTFAAAHPLVAPLVHSPPPGPDPYWLTLYLGYRNGRLLEASHMWLTAVGVALRDTAPCYVCYCHTHYADGSVPAVPCNQCHNKFHTHCVRRWFRSSNRSNCPVCRTNF